MKNLFQLSVLFLSLFLLSGFALKTEKNQNNIRSFSTEKEDLLFKSGSEEIKKLLIKGPDVFNKEDNDPRENKTGFDIDSKAKELNVDRNDLRFILNQINSEAGIDDSLGTEAINQQVITGYALNNFFGASVSGAGDVNGDGYADIIVGASNYNNGIGRVYLYHGSSLGINTTPAAVLTGDAPSSFGNSVSEAGDVNGDGYSDIIVGAWGYESVTGRAYVYHGSPSGINTTPAAILMGETTNNYFGGSVSGAGDINGDGYADIIVGARGFSSSTGKAYLYHGSSSGINTTPVKVLTGEAPFHNFARSVSGAGDVNGDGYADVIVGAEGYSSNTGRAYLYHGSSSGINITPLAVLTGETSSNFFGESVSGAGDVNGDGYSDIIVGAHGYNSATGRVYLYLGSSIGLVSTPAVVLTGEAANNRFGISVSGAGDVNGDGFSDIIVGASSYNNGIGRAYLFLASSTGINTTPAAFFTGEVPHSFGNSVSGAGDVNGDGYSDLIVGAFGYGSNRGRIYIYTNSMTGIDIPDIILNGASAGNRFGETVSGAGDVNGDGYADIIVGAPLYNSELGRIYLYIGSPYGIITTPAVVLTGEAANNRFGISVSGAGDVNGDGFSDIIVGASGYSFNTGRAYLYHGSSSGINITPAAILTGEAEGINFGYSVSGAGDVNGDGYSDIIVGAHFYNSATGRVYLYYGSTSGINTTPAAVFNGEAVNNNFGETVSGAGDVNKDGYADIIIGAPRYGSFTGRVYLYLGSPYQILPASVILTGEATNNQFGGSISGAGDVNGDGYSDIIVGAEGYSSNTGRAYLYLGSSLVINTIPKAVLTGQGTFSLFGISVSGAGDVNGDGCSDIIVGTFYSNKVYIYFGGHNINTTPSIVLSESAGGFGKSVAYIGDINKDELSDIAVGAPDFNNSTGRAFIYLSSAPIVKPRLVSVKDVSNDQGGYVHLRWMRSGYDVQNINKITDYLIERSRPPDQIGFSWEPLSTVPAIFNPSYTFTAPTWSDSNFNGSQRTYFRITARTENITEFWRSNIVFGQSIDNLAPTPPLNLSASQTQSSINLVWQENTEPDFHNYNIYRNDTLIGVSTSNSYTDVIIPTNLSNPLNRNVTRSEVDLNGSAENKSLDNLALIEYKISAVDINGNESDASDPILINFAPFTVVNVTLIPEGFYNSVTGHLNMRDTVIAYLLEAASPFAIVDTAFGILDSINFTAEFKFENADDGQYYIVIKHRNSLETWSKTGGEVYERGIVLNYSFTSSNSQAYGNNLILKNSLWCMISGDVNKNGVIDAVDRAMSWNERNFTGYKPEDVNGDGIVNAIDRGIIWNNRNKSIQRPGLLDNRSAILSEEDEEIKKFIK